MIAPFEWLLQGLGSFLIVILVASSAYPLFRFVRPLGATSALTSLLVYLSFPTVLLYTNRGLFPNLPVVALGLWCMWLLRRERSSLEVTVGSAAGLCLGLALIIRPTEAIWLLPWVVWSAWGHATIQRVASAAVTALIVCMVGYAASVITYEHWWPVVGYWLRDIVPGAVTSPAAAATPSGGLLRQLIPFGMHPRAMWWNVQTFLFGMMGWWTLISLLGLAWWGIKRWKKQIVWQEAAPILLAGWTLAVLLLLYGQSAYVDNIQGNAALGNSFLRYVLPIVPLLAIGIGLLAERLKDVRYGPVLAGVMVTALVAYGGFLGLRGGVESIFSVHEELMRYERIRSVAQADLPAGTVMLSERSDKIFSGLPFVIVSPLPEATRLQSVVDANTPRALFHRLLTPEQRETFAGGAFRDWLLASVFENEGLYIPPKPSTLPTP